jgi:hypothetical protein
MMFNFRFAGCLVRINNRIEKNHTEPHMTTVRKLAEALDVDPCEFVEG